MAYELVDNVAYGSHEQALEWLTGNYAGPLNVATGYVGLEGLDVLARVAAGRDWGGRLLIGASPTSEQLTGPASETVADRFAESVASLRRQRDFSAFPAPRRAVLERVAGFVESDDVEVRRYVSRFLHGKAYIVGRLNDAGATAGPGAALVSSANLTQGGLAGNLELGMVHYQPNVVEMALGWYERLWEEAQDFKDDLLELLRPAAPESDPQTVFLRALLELYGPDMDTGDAPPLMGGHPLTVFQQDGLARARRILEQYGGVLYADGVGMGKTEIGIQLIREHAQELGEHVLVISPAQLRDRLWQERLEQENLPGAVVSYQQTGPGPATLQRFAAACAAGEQGRVPLRGHRRGPRVPERGQYVVRGARPAHGRHTEETTAADGHAGKQLTVGPAQPVPAVRQA